MATKYYNMQEAAERYGCSVDHIHTLICRGQLAAIDIASDLSRRRRWAIPVEALEAFERERSVDNVLPPLVKDPPRQHRRRRQPENVTEFF